MAFMTHPQNGATHTNDVAEHEKAGWKVSTYAEWLGGKTQTESPNEPGSATEQGAEQKPETSRRKRSATEQGAEQ